MCGEGEQAGRREGEIDIMKKPKLSFCGEDGRSVCGETSYVWIYMGVILSIYGRIGHGV